MPNNSGICDNFKANILQGVFTGTASLNGSNIKAALYSTTGTLSNTTAYYTTSQEVATGGGYTAGGIGAPPGTVAITGNVAYWQPGGSLNFGTVTIGTAFDAVLLYTNAISSPNAIAVFNFGSTTVTAGNFSINMPTNSATQALIRLN